jgi:enoyl-CoA hydratase/carnithine racemase
MANLQQPSNGFARIEVENHRADVILDREEKRNAMHEPLLDDLTAAFRTVDDHPEIRAATLTGEGPVLSAGMDLNMMRGRADAADEGVDDALPAVLDAIDSCAVPTVAGIHGAAPAGAFELTLPFDFRIIGADAKYGVIEVKLGTFPHGGATQRLPRLIGLGKAKELVLTGEFVDPEEAQTCGLVNEVVPPGEVKSRTRAFADDLTENAPIGMRLAKRALDAAQDVPLEQGLELERSLGEQTYRTHDYEEGFQARLDDREPEFENR